ncbi:MAG: LUD domain-containing protein [Bacteroidia bacterium]|nr:LUD domain-containing protein [Bacteroidia bacterium]
MDTSREQILKRIKTALKKTAVPADIEKPDFSSQVFNISPDSLEIRFVEELQKVNGRFVFCLNEYELIENLQTLCKQSGWDSVFCVDKEVQKILINAGIAFNTGVGDFYVMNTGITRCEYLVARTGSIVVSSAHHSGRRMNVFPPVHIIIAYTSQIVEELKDAFTGLKSRYNGQLPSMISTITGPSRTSDIEKTLVLGAHGPKELYVFLVNDRILED